MPDDILVLATGYYELVRTTPNVITDKLNVDARRGSPDVGLVLLGRVAETTNASPRTFLFP